MWCHYSVDTVLLRWGCCHWAMLHSVAQAVAAAVLLIGDLSARRGLWRSDAAGAAQCGSGEAALCLLPILSLPLSFLIFFLLSLPPLTPVLPSTQFYLSFYIAFLPLPPPRSSFCFCFFPALLLPPLLRLVDLPGCMLKWIARRFLLLLDAVTLSEPALEVDASK